MKLENWVPIELNGLCVHNEAEDRIRWIHESRAAILQDIKLFGSLVKMRLGCDPELVPHALVVSRGHDIEYLTLDALG
jgi:hypothetical protein